MAVGWMVGQSGIKANSAQFGWSLAELGKNMELKPTQPSWSARKNFIGWFVGWLDVGWMLDGWRKRN